MATDRFNATNYHLIQVGYRNGRVWMKSHRFKDRIVVHYDHTYNSSLDIAWATLQRLGYKLSGSGEWTDSYVIASTTFEPLRDMLKAAKAKAKDKSKARR